MGSAHRRHHVDVPERAVQFVLGALGLRDPYSRDFQPLPRGSRQHHQGHVSIQLDRIGLVLEVGLEVFLLDVPLVARDDQSQRLLGEHGGHLSKTENDLGEVWFI